MTMWVRAISFETQNLVDTWNANNDSQIELTVVPAGTEFVTKMGAASALAVGHAPWSTVFPRLFNDPNGPSLAGNVPDGSTRW